MLKCRAFSTLLSRQMRRAAALALLVTISLSTLACDALFNLKVDNRTSSELSVWLGGGYKTVHYRKAAACIETVYASLVYHPGKPFNIAVKDPEGNLVLEEAVRPAGDPPQAKVTVQPKVGEECPRI